MSRKAHADLLAERTGHSDFKEYHKRFNHDPETWGPCECGAYRNRGHMFSCLLNAKALPVYNGSPLQMV